MKHFWLNKTNSNKKLILFFNGWGMDEKIVSHLECEDYDVVVLYDYNNLELDIKSLNLSQYTEKHIVAWSMGVMVATLFNFGEIKTATAICGTPFAIDNEYGIPERIYNLTIRGFSETSSKKFMERMFIEKPNMETFSGRTFDSKLSELKKMLEYKPNTEFQYTKAIVGSDDKIIPTKNQLNYWDNPTTINSGHCPFMLYKKWTELL